jgi:hypothetical protein
VSQGNGNGVIVWAERVPARLSWSELEERVRNVGKLKRALPFYVGDLVLACDEHGEKGSQLINEFGYSEGALANLRYVSRRFPPDERSVAVPWSIYQTVAPLDKRTRDKLITQVLSGEIDRAGIRALVRAKNGESDTVGENQTAQPPLVEALILVGKLLSREAGGEDVSDLLAPALDDLISYAMQRLGRLRPKKVAVG